MRYLIFLSKIALKLYTLPTSTMKSERVFLNYTEILKIQALKIYYTEWPPFGIETFFAWNCISCDCRNPSNTKNPNWQFFQKAKKGKEKKLLALDYYRPIIICGVKATPSGEAYFLEIAKIQPFVKAIKLVKCSIKRFINIELRLRSVGFTGFGKSLRTLDLKMLKSLSHPVFI